MVKRVLAFWPRVAALACLTVLEAACFGPRPSIPPQPTAVPFASRSVTSQPAGGIQFMVWGSGPQLQAYQSLVTLYQQRNPGRPVELVGIPGEADYQKRLAADIAAGRPADVIWENYTQVPGLAYRRLLTPVAPYLAVSPVLNLRDFSDGAISPFIFDSQLQCVPISASGLVVYFNNDLFRKAGLPAPGAGWTRDVFLADALALTPQTKGDRHLDQYGLGVEPTLVNLAPWIWQLKGQLVDNAAWPSELALTTPAVLSATSWLVSLQNQYHVAPDSQAELAEASDQRFVDGSLAMIIGTRASVPVFRQITAFEWDVAPLPASNTGPSNVVVADGMCLTSASANKAAAWQFIQFAASRDGQALLAQSGAIVPALAAVANSPAFLNPATRPAHSQVFLEALAHALALPKLENWSDIQAIADEELQQAFYGQKGVAQALEAATTRSEEYFKIHGSH